MSDAPKPPRGRPFVKGQSGNPKGPKRRVRSLRKLVEEQLSQTVKIIEEGGRTRKYTKREIIARQIVHEAMKTKPWALDALHRWLTLKDNDDHRLANASVEETRPGVFVFISNDKDREPSMRELLKAELDSIITVTENGRRVRRSKREILACEVVNQAARRKRAALDELFRILTSDQEPDSTEPIVITLNLGDKIIKN